MVSKKIDQIVCVGVSSDWIIDGWNCMNTLALLKMNLTNINISKLGWLESVNDLPFKPVLVQSTGSIHLCIYVSLTVSADSFLKLTWILLIILCCPAFDLICCFWIYQRAIINVQ